MITTINEWKKLLINESIIDFKNSNYVGIHCSPKSLNHDEFYGKIVDEYYMTFKQILGLIQDDYKGAKLLIEKIESFEDGISLDDDSIDVVFEIVDFFDENNLEWIFVSKDEPMTKYGNNCYRVYFNDLGKVYQMEDQLTKNAEIYIYNSKTDKPILKRCDC